MYPLFSLFEDIFLTIHMLTIKKASVHDAELLTNLSREIYKEYYLYLWHPGGAQWYMHEYAYAADKIKKDLSDSGIEYFIAFDEAVPAGYMKLVLSAVLPAYESKNAIEVERIYLHQNATGKGAGRQLMQLAMQRAKEMQKEIIFLKAMDSGKDAIAFYKKLGYTICGTMQLPMPTFSLMKEAYRGMLILKRDVE